MKFSYSFLKKLVPKIKSKKDLIDKINLRAFEAEDLGKDTLDVKLPPNRFSDAIGHLGLATEISAIYGKNYKLPITNYQLQKINIKAPFEVKIKDKNLCPRYATQYFENIEVKPSPKWMQEILISCGLKPINNVVDIMNYTMLEIGQPLHAFDYDKMEGEKRGLTRKQIIVRRAKKGERITTLDSQTFELDENTLVIAGSQKLLAIAGIKGGKKAEVNENTKRIIVEAANFNSANIYKSSRKLGLITDASLRFSRNLSPELVGFGLNRAAQLLEKIAKADNGAIIDIYPQKPRKKIVGLNIDWLNKFIGCDFTVIEAKFYLDRLGFKIVFAKSAKGEKSFINKKASDFFVEVPILRQDIESQEDLAEEITRLYGYNDLPSVAPRIHLKPLGSDSSENAIFKDKVRRILASMGADEILSYSFISENEGNNFGVDNLMELANPVSKEFCYLRPSLESGLIKSISDNFRFFDVVRVFEIGNVFSKIDKEKLMLGLAFGSKTKEMFFELKGVIDRFLKSIGIVDYLFVPENNELKIKSNGKTIGRLVKINDKNHISLAEMNLNDLLLMAIEENEYRPLSKFPSIMRDLSISIDKEKRIGEIMNSIQQSDLKFISDVDLIDEYENEGIGKNKLSLTFRIVFQAKDRTLTDDEANKMMGKIINELKNRFKAEIR